MKKSLYTVLLSFSLIGAIRAESTNTHIVVDSIENKEQSLLDTTLEHIGGFVVGCAGMCVQNLLSASMAHVAGLDGSILMKAGSFILPAALIYYAKKQGLEIPFFKKKRVAQSMAIGAFFAPMIAVDQYLFSQ